MTPPNASTAMAGVLVDELVRGGVTDLVLSPGSRSASLALAAHAAAVAGRLRLHTRIDERSAGFLALGIARSSRRPVAVVTTSGTAVANLHPAVLEAAHSGVPLVLLTADRPARLRGTGANQTTDQGGIFGGAVRQSLDLAPGHPGAEAHERRQVVGWRAMTARALAAATGRLLDRPGPVHLNVQVDEPLLHQPADGWTADTAGRPDGAAWSSPGPAAQPEPEPVRGQVRGVVLAGDDAGPPARVFAETAGWPLLAEPTSGSRTGANVIRTYRLLLDEEALGGTVEQVVVFGHPTLSRPVNRLLSRSDVGIVGVRSPAGWTDVGHRAGRFVEAVRLDGDPADGSWLEAWRTRDAAVSQALDALLAGRDGLTAHAVAGAVSAAVPPGGLLFVGASNPVRDLDLMVAPYRVGDRRMVVGNRGLAGIDGSVSSAVGAALGRPHSSRAIALLGDVTFLHDSNGLVLGPDEERPDLTIVVVNDDGGSIFATLEQGAAPYAASFERLFGTPHGVDLAALCAATGTPHRRVRTAAELRHALDSPGGGIEVVEAVVRRDDRRELDAAVRGLISQT